MRKFLALALVLAACTEEERPATLEVVTLTILAPNCGQVMCHSTTTRREELAFDTVEAANESLVVDLGVLSAINRGEPLQNDLMFALLGDDKPQMPPDSPLHTEDIQLIRTWILAGAPGLVVP